MARTKQRENYGNGSVTAVTMPKVGPDGAPVLDKDGKPVKVQKKDRSGNPSWRVCVTLGVEQYVDASGKPRKRQRKVQKTYHGTLAGARAYCKQLSEEYANLTPATVGNTFADAVEAWRKEMELNGTCAPSKLRDYTSRLGYVSPYLSTKALVEVTQNDVTAALQGAKVARNLSQGTIKDVFALTKRVFRRAVAWRWIAANPMEDAKTPRVDEPVERRYLSVEQCAQFMAALDAAEDAAYSDFEEKEERALEFGTLFGRTRIVGLSTISAIMAVRLMLATGCRRGEALGLLWDCVDLDAGQVRICTSLNKDMVFKTTKTAAGKRTLSIDAVTVEHLKRWKEFQKHALNLVMVKEEDGTIHSVGQTDKTPVACSCEGGFLAPRNIARWWYEFRAEVGFPTLRMHELRHTQASLLIAAGYDMKTVQCRLGHDDVAVTLKHYAHLIPQRDKDAADFMGSVLYAKPKTADVFTFGKTA